MTQQCCVYGNGMSRLSLLVLARQHNDINQIQRATTFPEVAASCRRLLYAHFSKEDGADDGKYMPEVPRYNAQKYRDFKQECVGFICSSRVVRSFCISVYVVKQYLYSEPSICGESHTNGNTTSTYLPQDARCLHGL